MNILMLLQMAAQAMPERCAVSCGGQSLSYQQLYLGAGAAAKAFKHSGAERVCQLGVSSLAVPLSLFGAAAAGLPYVPLNYRLQAEKLDALITRVSPAYMVAEASWAQSYASRDGITLCSATDLLALTRSAEPIDEAPDPWQLDAEATAVQIFTSGTTGTPKAALLRNRNLASYILGSVEFGAAAEDDAVLITVPPYHVAGISALLSSVYAGRRMVFLPEFDAATWLELCRKEKVSNAFVVPTMLSRIVELLEAEGRSDANLPALRALAYGGGRMPRSVIEKAMSLFPDTDFTNAYGLTETSSTICLLGPDEHRRAVASEKPDIRRRLTSVGKALPTIEIEIRDPHGKVLPPNTQGEIFVRGEQVAGEYREQGSQLDAEGWFATRDAGFLDEDGFLFLDGRADDVIVRGGENISPAEIEDVLLECEAVSDAAALAVPSTQWGESIAVAVVLKPGTTLTPEDLRRTVKTKLRSSRVPEHILYLDELPYNEMGKLLRRELRPLFSSEVAEQAIRH